VRHQQLLLVTSRDLEVSLRNFLLVLNLSVRTKF
jgi:hypothetical protein